MSSCFNYISFPPISKIGSSFTYKVSVPSNNSHIKPSEPRAFLSELLDKIIPFILLKNFYQMFVLNCFS